jgi:hypothetical protein
MAVPRLREIVKAWSALPPPLDDEAAWAHLGTDVYGGWKVTSALPARAYGSREFVLRLAQAWAEASGRPPVAYEGTSSGVGGAFEWILGSWVLDELHSGLREAWTEDLGPTGRRALLTRKGMEREWPDMLVSAVQSPWAWPFVVDLLDLGVPLDGKDRNGTSPACQAFRCLPPEHAALLLAKGLKVDARDKDGCTLLHCAVGNETHAPGLVRMLLERGADPAARNLRGETALRMALWPSPGRMEVVQLLLGKGADPNAADCEGGTPLHALAEDTADPEDVVSARAVALLLVSRGARLDARKTGKSAKLPEDDTPSEAFRDVLRTLRLATAPVPADGASLR